MQAELMYRKSIPAMATPVSLQELAMSGSSSSMSTGHHRIKQESRDSRETIHSGHFMVSDFEAEAQDDEDELAVPVPDEESARLAIIAPPGFSLERFVSSSSADKSSQQLSIETSLNKLFQCMSLAYRQKLTSPKWNRFKGIRLRWKDKIRLNNVIWRCWHMQFILKQSTLVCQFASPLDVDTHNKPEAVVLEGKYWKRKLAAVTAEYKKWRMFYRNKILGWTNKDGSDMLESMDTLEWCGGVGNSGLYGIGEGSSYGSGGGTPAGDGMMVDEDYMELMTDTLFSTISSNQPLYFPDPREIARGASLADFIQPSLGPLQPNLDDFIDTLEPLQEFLSSRLPPVPEEDVFQSGALAGNYSGLELMAPTMNQVNPLSVTAAETTMTPVTSVQQQQQQLMQTEQQIQNLQYTAKIYTQSEAQASEALFRNNVENFNSLAQSYEQQMQQASHAASPSRETKPRQSRATLRASRLAQPQESQQQQQQQQQAFPTSSSPQQQQQQQQQHMSFQTTPQRDYSMEIQSSPLATSADQMQLSIADQANQQMQALINQHQQQSFVTVDTQQQQQTEQPCQKQMKPGLTCKPYSKIAIPGYKFSPPPASFDAQQCKFTANVKPQTLPATPQPVVAVTAQQSAQPHVLLQCKTAGIDLTAPAQHPTKLLPRPSPPAQPEVREEVFAVPKYQMKARSRSRSSSSLSAPRIHPPLVSAVSDPALNINNNVLLAHLLTNNSSSLYTMGASTTDKTGSQQMLGVKHILPMLPSAIASSSQVANVTHPISIPTAIQSLQNASSAQQQQSVSGQSVMLNTSSQQSQSSSPSSPKDTASAHSPQSLSLSPMHSPLNMGSPMSPSRVYVKGDPERGHYKEQRRVGHIHAEQKRRYNIKNGFDMLYSLIPQLSQNPNTKMSKAAMLQKGADYIRLLRSERHQLKDEMDKLRQQIDSLNASISNCQAMLPATGAPVSRQRTSKMKEMFDEYVRTRTRENWKFWIFSVLLEPLMVSFNSSVSTASIEDLYRTTILWVEQHCSLVDLRPAVLNSLRYLCTATDILNDPSRLPEEALAAVSQNEQQKSTP